MVATQKIKRPFAVLLYKLGRDPYLGQHVCPLHTRSLGVPAGQGIAHAHLQEAENDKIRAQASEYAQPR